jgi:hypothetical protein
MTGRSIKSNYPGHPGQPQAAARQLGIASQLAEELLQARWIAWLKRIGRDEATWLLSSTQTLDAALIKRHERSCDWERLSAKDAAYPPSCAGPTRNGRGGVVPGNVSERVVELLKERGPLEARDQARLLAVDASTVNHCLAIKSWLGVSSKTGPMSGATLEVRPTHAHRAALM